MSYCTVQDLADEYGAELSQAYPDGSGSYDAALVAQTLDDFAGQMDEYIGSRYALPIVNPTASRAAWLRRVNMEGARYLMWKHGASEKVRKAYEDHIAYLRDLAKGVIQWTDLNAPEETAAGDPDYLAVDPIFDANSLAGY